MPNGHDDTQPLLHDWTNGRTRFPTSRFMCPTCGHALLEDNWPPNYGGGSGAGMGGEFSYNYRYSQKCVCLSCKIAVRVTVTGGTKRQDMIEFSDAVPLVERDGKWLTPHDVVRERYKDEHGEYPMEAYA